MRVDRVRTQPDQFDPTLRKFGFELGEGAQLGGADGRIVLGMGEENDPFVTDEFMEVDGPGGGVGFEVWGYGTEAEAVIVEYSVGCSEGKWVEYLRCWAIF